MASPLQTAKKSVNLAAPGRVSKIRRDPPPVVKKIEIKDPEDRDTQTVVVGVVGFALAIFIITLGFSAYYGSVSREDRTIHLNLN
jgi:hypothetical protein